ncbi:MAG TPA: TldD/PmbA family protein [Acidimicrobiales bacterium]|nr:TldD/PmbA family protein [Acidimicrobiales bacterium]
MPDLGEVARRVAGWAREGEQVEAYVSWARETDVRAYQGDVESLSSAESEGIGIRVISRSRQGFAYGGSLDEQVLADTLAEARDNASFATEDPAVGLPEPDGRPAVELDLWRDELVVLPAADKVAMALELERQVKAGDPRVRQVEASFGDVAVEVAVASSTGVFAAHRRTACHVAGEAVVGDPDDSHVGVGYSVGRAPADLDLTKASEEAVRLATRLIGARKPRSARLPVVLDRRVTTSLLGVLSGTFSGEAVLKGRSLFAERMGEPVAAGSVTLVDDPTIAEAFAATPHDAEGLATRRNVLIDGGVLSAFLYDSYSARRAGTTSTGSAVRGGFKGAPGVGCRALSLAPGHLDLDGILADIGEGLLVQSMSGLHSGVNPVSGDFSVGVEGLMFRNGELAEPVREATMASTLQRMLLEVVAIGGDLEWLPGMAAGLTLAIDGISVSGS